MADRMTLFDLDTYEICSSYLSTLFIFAEHLGTHFIYCRMLNQLGLWVGIRPIDPSKSADRGDERKRSISMRHQKFVL